MLMYLSTGQPAHLSVTATNIVTFLYVDNKRIIPQPNNFNNWEAPDRVPIETYSRLVAIRANNVEGGCSGIMASIDMHPLVMEFVSNSSRWVCSASAPNGWEVS
jgi:hypothetical protein